MRDFLAVALGARGRMANDGQAFAGFYQDVYRKWPFHFLFKCGGDEVARLATDYFDRRYNLSAASRETIARKVAPFRCHPFSGDYNAIGVCVRRPPAPAPPRLEPMGKHTKCGQTHH